MKLFVAAVTSGNTLNSSISGPRTMPPPIPKRLANIPDIKETIAVKTDLFEVH